MQVSLGIKYETSDAVAFVGTASDDGIAMLFFASGRIEIDHAVSGAMRTTGWFMARESEDPS